MTATRAGAGGLAASAVLWAIALPMKWRYVDCYLCDAGESGETYRGWSSIRLNAPLIIAVVALVLLLLRSAAWHRFAARVAALLVVVSIVALVITDHEEATVGGSVGLGRVVGLAATVVLFGAAAWLLATVPSDEFGGPGGSDL